MTTELTRTRRRRPRLKRILRHVALTAMAILMLYPIIWMVISSLRPDEMIFSQGVFSLSDLSFDNYREGWDALRHPFGHYMINSTIITVGSIIANLIACSMTAYAFARLRFRGNRMFFAIMLLTIMLPVHVLLVPQYVLFSALGWTNTPLPFIVPKLLATDAFFIFLMVQFIRGIPRDRKSTRLNSSHVAISYAVFCLK